MFINRLPSKMTKNIELKVNDCNGPMPDPHDLDMSRKNICVFDNMVTESNQNSAESYYTRGRHNNVSCIYISQSYHLLPRQTIRANTNFIVLFKVPNKDLKHIHNDICSGDISYKEFKKLYQDAWETNQLQSYISSSTVHHWKINSKYNVEKASYV